MKLYTGGCGRVNHIPGDDAPIVFILLSPLPVVPIAPVAPRTSDMVSAATVLALGLMQMGMRHVPVTPHSR